MLYTKSSTFTFLRGESTGVFTDVVIVQECTEHRHVFIFCFRNQSLKDCHEEIDFQADVVADIGKDADYGYDLNVSDMFHVWEGHKHENILTYRDHAFTSKYTGTTAPVHHTPFMKAMDDSMECFLNGASKNSVS